MRGLVRGGDASVIETEERGDPAVQDVGGRVGRVLLERGALRGRRVTSGEVRVERRRAARSAAVSELRRSPERSRCAEQKADAASPCARAEDHGGSSRYVCGSANGDGDQPLIVELGDEPVARRRDHRKPVGVVECELPGTEPELCHGNRVGQSPLPRVIRASARSAASGRLRPRAGYAQVVVVAAAGIAGLDKPINCGVREEGPCRSHPARNPFRGGLTRLVQCRHNEWARVAWGEIWGKASKRQATCAIVSLEAAAVRESTAREYEGERDRVEGEACLRGVVRRCEA